MPRPISPAEWDALTPRQRRARGAPPRPTQQEYEAALHAHEEALRAAAEVSARIAPMLEIGGREWTSKRGQHRIYFDAENLPRYDTSRGGLSGYYDVERRVFVKVYGVMTDEEFGAFIGHVMETGGDLPGDVEITFDCMGAELREGDTCVLVAPRDASSWNMDLKANVGRVVVTAYRILGWQRLTSHWAVVADDPSAPLLGTGKSFVCEQRALIVRSSSLMRIGPGRHIPAPAPADPTSTELIAS